MFWSTTATIGEAWAAAHGRVCCAYSDHVRTKMMERTSGYRHWLGTHLSCVNRLKLGMEFRNHRCIDKIIMHIRIQINSLFSFSFWFIPEVSSFLQLFIFLSIHPPSNHFPLPLHFHPPPPPYFPPLPLLLTPSTRCKWLTPCVGN